MLKTLVFLTVVAGAVWLYFRQTVQQQLRDKVESNLNQKFEGSGLQIRIGNARFYEQQGIRLGNVELTFQLPEREQDQKLPVGSRRSNLQVYEMFVHMNASMADLATQEIEPSAIELKRARLTLVRTPNGKWDFEPILEQLKQVQLGSGKLKPVTLTDCEIQFVDPQRDRPVVVSGVDFSIGTTVHQKRELVEIKGRFQTRAVSSVDLTTYIDATANRWFTRLEAQDARLSRELVSLLPRDIAAQFVDLKTLTGQLNFSADVEGALDFSKPPRFDLRGQVSELSVDDTRLPMSVQRASADFGVNNQGFTVTKAQGGLGEEGHFENFNYLQHGLLDRQRWECSGSVTNFMLDHRPRMARWLPENCSKFCKDFSPHGTSDIAFRFRHDGTELKRTIQAKLKDMSFSFIRMPYRVDHWVGDVVCENNRCDFDVSSRIGEQPVRMHGFANGISNQPTFVVNMEVPGNIPLDEKLLESTDAQPKLAKVVRAFRPSGRVKGVGRITKAVPNGPVRRDFDIRFEKCSVRHRSFDYPIYNVAGQVKIRGDRYDFIDVHGNNSSGKVDCNGSWDLNRGLDLTFTCRSVPLNDQLRSALKPEIREIWNGFRPSGKLGFMKVGMTMPVGQKHVDLVVEADMASLPEDPDPSLVSVDPKWFPYEVDQLVGKVKIGNGVISLRNISGKHDNTTVSFIEGNGRYSGRDWSLNLSKMLVSSLRVDKDLLAAVPRSLAPSLARLRYQGLINVNGEVTIAGNKTLREKKTPVQQIGTTVSTNQFPRRSDGIRRAGFAPQPVEETTTSLAWDLRLDMSQAKMQVGLPIKNVFGSIFLEGSYDGENVNCDGKLDIDSLTVHETQITNVLGPIRIENDRVLAGIYADQASDQAYPQVSPVAEPNVAQPVTGVLHGGVLRLDAQLNSSARNDFYVQATLADSSLETACRELAPDLKNVEGHSFAAIRLRGDGSGSHSHRGEGSIQLRDAKIYELPVFIALLKVPSFRRLSRTAFDSSNIDFKIHGEVIDFERMEFIGDAISLIGNGQMNMDRDIDLNFYSVMGRGKFHLPVFTAASQKVLWIKVDGKLDNPVTHRKAFAGLEEMNENLRQLFLPRQRMPSLRHDRNVRPASATRVGESYFGTPGRQPFEFSTK